MDVPTSDSSLSQNANEEIVVRPPRPLRPRISLGLSIILLTTFLVYLPAMNGDRLWDDDGHITKPELQSLSGLYHIWFTLGATQQYYPLLHSAFWLEHQLWGDSVLGYHLVNVFWHLVAISLVYLILTKLKIPGALLATAIFALHPVMVESVAWMTEQKNTLSAVFYLSALRVYLAFDESRQPSRYLFALGLFTLGLLTKTVTATLPAALLVIFWWQRGTISWRRDVLPLVPFFALGAIAGLGTAWVERKLIGAEGAEFELTILQRSLLSGRVIWFYLSKLLWPDNLIFIYPHWTIDPAQVWQWIFSISVIVLTIALWSVHKRWRAPLAAWLFFCGTLFPVLGFLNVYPFIYSFVADHFQYLASLGVIVLASAGITRTIARLPRPLRAAANLGCCVLVAVLAMLTWNQSGSYSDNIALYRTTIEKNPSCWLAELNLGTLIANGGQSNEAMTHFYRALEINPNCADAHSNIGIQLCTKGEAAEGMKHLMEAVRISPRSAPAHLDLANGLLQSGQVAEAVEHCEEAVQLAPNSPFAQFSLGLTLVRAQRADEAIPRFKRAIELQPNYGQAYDALARAYARLGRSTDAIATAQQGARMARGEGELEFAGQMEAWLANYREEISSATKLRGGVQ
jgi:tetratricopeptide (TPR) repeat protein